jgi:hypothetical protein
LVPVAVQVQQVEHKKVHQVQTQHFQLSHQLAAVVPVAVAVVTEMD